MRAPRIESATAADIPALIRLRAELGWQPNSRLLRAIQAWAGGRIFLIRESSFHESSLAGPNSLASGAAQAPVVTTSAIAAGPVGVIGNVIVRSDYRRRGLGRVIMEATLRWLRERGVEHVLLAATPEGRPLYTRLGFVALAPSWFAHGSIASLDRWKLLARAGEAHASLTPASGLERLASLDVAAFGGDRLGLLELLLREPRAWLYVGSEAAGEPGGYLMLRQLSSRPASLPETLQVGPWVAKTPQVAAALLAAALAPDAAWRERMVSSGEPRIQAIVDRREALALLAEVGASLGEDDIVMRLDFAPGGPSQSVAEHPDWLYAWLAPMVF